MKENENLENIPIIIFSTSFTRGNDFEPYFIKTFTKMGAQAYIRKPNSLTELKEVIQQTLIKLIEGKSF